VTTALTFDPTAGVAEISAQTRAWILDNLPAAWLDAVHRGDLAAVDEMTMDPAMRADWYDRLGAAGLATPTWPVEYGGLGLSTTLAAGIREALLDLHAGRPEADFVGLELAAATILQWGTPEQKQRFLPPLGRGSQRWCQLFSEPGSGSDLASLATRAVAQPDGSWLLNGQKVWSSYAHLSDFGILMARTDPTVPKHQGISFFLLDMRLPGVTVRPLRQMTGNAEFNEVFFDDVRIPPEALLGPLGEGWAVGISTLMAERSGITGRPTVGPGRATALTARAVRTGAWESPLLRDRLVDLFVQERALQMTTIRAFEESRGRRPGAEGSVRKLTNAELDVLAGTLAADLEDTCAIAWDPAEPTPAAVQQFLAMKTISIAGGTSEIQRNIIGERMLGLPKEPDPQQDVPFQDRKQG
jgi:3-oxochol-4-en-24-oyl-CoA dehydrogenase